MYFFLLNLLNQARIFGQNYTLSTWSTSLYVVIPELELSFFSCDISPGIYYNEFN